MIRFCSVFFSLIAGMTLTGCGTASHLLGRATGMLGAIASPVISPLIGSVVSVAPLSDSPKENKAAEATTLAEKKTESAPNSDLKD